MSELQLFTAEVFQMSKKSQSSSNDEQLNNNNQHETISGYKLIKGYPNMTSARIIKGKMIELEHSNLVGQQVKFKTVINYSRSLEPDTNLGVVLKPQEGYTTKPDTDK